MSALNDKYETCQRQLRAEIIAISNSACRSEPPQISQDNQKLKAENNKLQDLLRKYKSENEELKSEILSQRSELEQKESEANRLVSTIPTSNRYGLLESANESLNGTENQD